MNNKNLKRYLAIIVLLIITVLNPAINAEPSIIVQEYDIWPSEFMPGDRGILTLMIINSETQALTTETSGDSSNSISITENNGVVIDKIWIKPAGDDNDNEIYSTAGFNGYEDLGNLGPGSFFHVPFEIIADENISEGYYFPDVKIDLKNDEFGNYQDVTFPIKIRVSNSTIDLITNDVPSKISIGGSTDISLKVVNKRNNNIHSISIIENDNNDLDFNPESIFIGTMESGESRDIILSINPSEMGAKILSLNLTYKNGDNQHYKKYDIPIDVVEVLDVAPIFTNIPLTIKKGKSSRIGLEVYNAKTESITGVIITPIINTTVIPSQYFIGAMDPDDVFSVSFDIYSDMLDYGNHTIKFKLSYKQGNEYYETPSIDHSFNVVAGEGSSFQSSTNDNSELPDGINGDVFSICILTISIIVVLIIVFILWRWKKGRKQ